MSETLYDGDQIKVVKVSNSNKNKGWKEIDMWAKEGYRVMGFGNYVSMVVIMQKFA